MKFSLIFGSLNIIRGREKSTGYVSKLRNVDLPIKIVYTETWLLSCVVYLKGGARERRGGVFLGMILRARVVDN